MKTLFGFLLVIVFVLLPACKNLQESKAYKVGFSQCIVDEWRESMYQEMLRELIFHEEIELLYQDAGASNEKQIVQIREFLKQGIDLLIISPNEDEALRPIIEEVYQSGIPVIMLDRKVTTDKYTTYIGASNRLIGQEAARYIVRLLNGNGDVLEAIENQSITAFRERSAGLNEILAAYPGIRMDTVKAMFAGEESFKSKIRSNAPDVVFAPTDVAAKFSYELALSGGVTSIKFIGIDGLSGENGGLRMVEEGVLTATLLYPTGGDVAIKVAIDILSGKKVEKSYELKTVIIDSTNVSAIQIQSERLQQQQQDITKLAQRLTVMIGVFQNQKTLIYLFAALFILSAIFLGGMIISLDARKRINSELRLKNAQISTYAEEAEKANQAKMNFFTNISHEFRTPLTLIISPLEDLIKSKDLKPFQGNLQLIRKNSQRLLLLVDQIMDFRKSDTGNMHIRAHQGDLVKFVEEIVESFTPIAKERKIQLHFTSDQAEIALWFDPGLLDKVVFNLLSNALKFTSQGGNIQVKISKSLLEEEVRMVVEDSGQGMSEEDLKHVFDRFYQGELNRSLGTGIGLSLTKEIILLHHGQIYVSSIKGKGTSFDIRLRTGAGHFEKNEIHEDIKEFIIREPHIEFVAEEQISIGKAKSPRSEAVLLIIEDNVELRHYLKSEFSTYFGIVESDEVSAGIKSAFEEVPDLIICDLMLKNESGYTVVKTLKSDIRTSHIPIIILTAKTSLEDKLEGIRLGADDYITKPFNFSLLHERVNTLLLNREKLREHYSIELPIEHTSETASPRLDKRFVNEFTAVVEKNVSNSVFGVPDICEELGLSRVQLYRKVKAILGYSVSDYITGVRMKKAKQLLSTSEYSVSEVASMVGYSSAAYFSTAFRNHFGVTPSDFKGSSG